MGSQREDDMFDYGGLMQRSWETGWSIDEHMQQEFRREYTEEGLPILGPYEFGM